MVWRIWEAKGTPLKEIWEEWTYPDLLKANAILDMMADVEIARSALEEEELRHPGKP